MENQNTNKDTRKRRTYSLSPERASDLIRCQLRLESDLGRSVYRQDVLDAVVQVLEKDASVYKRVLSMLR